jgi:peroxiredoxin
LRPTLDAKGVALVAICTDTPEQLRAGRDQHGARVTLLSDPDLEITDRYNLRNPFNISPKGLSGLPIPTTFLVDADGIVRWIDQTDDYQLRSAPERVLAAIETGLEGAAGEP